MVQLLSQRGGLEASTVAFLCRGMHFICRRHASCSAALSTDGCLSVNVVLMEFEFVLVWCVCGVVWGVCGVGGVCVCGVYLCV